jgi:hypothetical protein
MLRGRTRQPKVWSQRYKGRRGEESGVSLCVVRLPDTINPELTRLNS